MPKSPRLTCIPSASFRISSIFRNASTLSILACIRICFPLSPRHSRIALQARVSRKELTIALIHVTEHCSPSAQMNQIQCPLLVEEQIATDRLYLSV